MQILLALSLCATTVMAKLSWYDPELCLVPDLRYNCFDPSRWWKMAAGHDARLHYGEALACPVEFAIGSRFEISGSRWGLADGEWICLDRGGAIVTRPDGSIVLDLLRDSPVWGEVLPVTAYRACEIGDRPGQPDILEKISARLRYEAVPHFDDLRERR